MTRKSIKIAASLFIALALTAAKPPMKSEQLDATAQAISETTMSPFCPGRTISSCPSPQARDLRGQIYGWLEQGYTSDAVRNQLLMIYGEDVRGVPQSEGFGLVGWFGPVVFVLLAILLVLLKLRRMKTEKGAVPVSPAATESGALSETEAKIEAALRRRMT